jgi:hypothetical protein
VSAARLAGSAADDEREEEEEEEKDADAEGVSPSIFRLFCELQQACNTALC